MMLRQDIKDVLYAWGRSKRVDEAPNDYPAMAAFAKSIARGNINPGPAIDDEYHDRVDSEVSRLKLHNEVYHAVILGTYSLRLHDSQIGKVMRCSRNTVRTNRIAGEAYLAARLDL